MNHYHQRSLENAKSLELIHVVIYYYFFCVQKPYCDIPTKKQALLITVIKGKFVTSAVNIKNRAQYWIKKF